MTSSQVVYDETIEDGFHGFGDKTQSFASAVSAISIEISCKRVVTFCTVKTKRKIAKRSKTKQQSTGTVWRKLSFKCGVKKMASCRLSSEIEGVKNHLSPVQHKSKIPVRRVPRLENNSGKGSSSEDEVNMKQRILRNRVEKGQKKPPSRIPIAIGRASSKDVGIATGKKPLGRDSGIVNIYNNFTQSFWFNI